MEIANPRCLSNFHRTHTPFTFWASLSPSWDLIIIGFSTDGCATTNFEQVPPRGIELFKQGLLLLRPSYEEPTIEQVEALNLMTFYCYSLNRRKTAYAYAGMALRLAMLLGLSRPQTKMSLREQEHRKRIWWTTVCMDIMTCTELSLTPAAAFDEDSVGFPDNSELSVRDAEEFSDPQYLTAQVKLCRIKYQILKKISELRFGNAVEAQALIEPCIHALKNWRLEFSPTLEFTEEGEFSDETLTLPPMRTIASLLLRYNQCLILLLRPLLLKQLYDIIHEQVALEPLNDLASLNTQCLQAATNNTKIQFALSKCHKIAKFGFWESLHIFSSLTVYVISGFLMEKRATSFTSAQTNVPYTPVRNLLGEMARVGNAASKDHERMIQDIEDLFRETPSHTGLTEGIEDLGHWPECVNVESMGFDVDETLSSFGWS
ncbi:Pyruvate/Phosphoenolpyruvate kinase [Penicillium digitatum]|uniref:Pyruvate/Phosphoenolpyruvate kinase n=1 Tax=Penicillium digitatum TaxID=36651 RepID=A0A7T6XT34_PENDI|nr:Pyruvate/Phosphoenolpyruvate kinase [Penicillium digitatum]